MTYCFKLMIFKFPSLNLNFQIYVWLRTLPEKYPGIVELKIVGDSFEKRPILGVKVSFSDTPKKTVIIEGNIHAREW